MKEAFRNIISNFLETVFRLRKNTTPRRDLRMLVGPFSSYKKYEVDAKKFIDGIEKLMPHKSNIKVLDVGSGSGRLTFELFSRRPSWQYYGFDIIRKIVDWSTAVAVKTGGKLSFVHSDIYNSLYNPKGSIQASSYKFPYNSNTFSLVIVQSVFTHMMYLDIINYIAEIERVLKPGGICICTFFIINNKSKVAIKSGKSSFSFPNKIRRAYINDDIFPEAAVAYDEKVIHQLFEKVNLKIKNNSIQYGSWYGEHGVALQDIVSVRKT